MPRIKSYKSLVLILLVSLTGTLLPRVSGAAEITIGWTYKNFPTQIKIHEAKQTLPIWKFESVSNLEKAGVFAEIKDSKLNLEPNRRKKFALVAFNPTEKPIYFFAAPHTTHPGEHALGFKFQCLCINHVFVIQPKQYWYRIVEIRISPGSSNKPLNITHEIIGTDKDNANKFGS
ncbi:MAG: hypothetical protein H7326_08940 [Bdellovibrionaceae bacterium]|nr:hypothetical protein [Pseudobdellovibrionaceae bacterium]